MGSLFTSISGQFAKLVLLGTMFPVLIIAGLNLILISPLLSFGPALEDRLKRVALGDASWPVVAFTFVVLLLTGLLYNLNIPIIRLYEGYPWKESWLGKQLAQRSKDRLTRSAVLGPALRHIRRELRKHDRTDPLISKLIEQDTELSGLLNKSLPDEEDLVLPTRFGNVIRSFERYPSVAYGMDAIALWPRLVAKIDSSFATTIDEAKISLDFMLNCSFLSALTACAVVSLWAADDAALWTRESLGWAWRAAVFVGLAFLFYQWAINAAFRWGVQVRAAFDLYRFELLRQLGYEQRPSSIREERALWQRISYRLLWADWQDDLPAYKDVPSRVTASPADVRLTAARVITFQPTGVIDVRVTVENQDLASRDASDVQLVETIPEGYRCIAGSVSAARTKIEVGNLKPLELRLGTIGPGISIPVSYSLKPSGGA